MQAVRRSERFMHAPKHPMTKVSALRQGRPRASRFLRRVRMGAGLALAVTACRPEPSRSSGSQNVRSGKAPSVEQQSASSADDGQWVMPAKNYASTRFSALDEINGANVKQLHVVETFSTGVLRGHEAAPLVVGDRMYVITPFPNIVYALDLARPGLGLVWRYDPRPELAAQGVACCDVVNRGLVYDQGRLFFATLDDHVVALDAASGKRRLYRRCLCLPEFDTSAQGSWNCW